MDQLEVSGSRFTIRRATRSDVPGLVALLADGALGAGRETAGMETYLEAFAAVDSDPSQYLAAVRDPDGDLVATMQLTLIPGLSRGGTTRLQVEAVRVAAGVRGAGLGTALLEWAHAWGRRHGATLVQLTSDKTRTDAHRFYVALGYRPSHEGFKRTL